MADSDPALLLDLAVAIAREVGALQVARIGDEHAIDTKSSAIDLVTDVDRASDALIRERILDARPDDGLVTEEARDHEGRSGVRWIVDPLDGTTNYAHGFPHFSVSIGVERDGERVAGVVHDPSLGETFCAVRGGGARLNGKPIRVSPQPDLKRALLATGFPYDMHDSGANLARFGEFMMHAQAVRRAGSAALDFAYVACGRFEGFWEAHLNAWDVSAGYLLVEEAGGRISDFTGGPAPWSGTPALASNGHVHDAMLEIIRTTAARA